MCVCSYAIFTSSFVHILVHDDNEDYIVLSERGLHGFGTCKFLFLKSRLHCRLGIAKIVFNMQVVEKKLFLAFCTHDLTENKQKM